MSSVTVNHRYSNLSNLKEYPRYVCADVDFIEIETEYRVFLPNIETTKTTNRPVFKSVGSSIWSFVDTGETCPHWSLIEGLYHAKQFTDYTNQYDGLK